MTIKKSINIQNGLDLKIFSDEELEILHQGTLRILENTGIMVDDEEALSLFANAGAVIEKNNVVKIPGYLVEDSIKSAPASIYLAGRGDKGFTLGDGDIRFCSFGEAPQIVDPYSKEVRSVTKADEENYAKLVDSLEEHDMCWDAWVASDVPASTYTLHSLDAYFNNTVKPVCIATPDGILAKATVEMATAVAGNKENLQKNPLMIAGTCPKSPLHLDNGICQSIIILAKAGVPNMNMSALTTGGTGPVTLSGTIMVHNAEMLACVVLSQLAKKGSPIIYGSCTSGLDLRKATATYGCPELGMFSAAFSKLSQYYKIPHVVAGFWTDSKVSDMQSGHEKTLSGILPALAGADMIFGTGCLAAGMIGSFGQLVADNEMIAMLRHVKKGISVEDVEADLAVIEKVGPQGNYLSEEHTMKNMRTCLAQPVLLDRNNYNDWVSSGSKTYIENAQEKAVTLLENHSVPSLSDDVKNTIAKIIAETELLLK
ncbi:MAG: trimethylamine methyltransferase family protein [Clostridiales bacterium]